MADEIDPDDPTGPDIGVGEAAGAAALAGAAAACLACGAALLGAFCATCGQKNDDMRRNSFLLARDFLTDTFGFDSRMWRTIGLMAVAPGAVPSNYAHGKRSRYTPPVRFFLVSSFLFFVVLALTHTMFVAVEITRKTEAEIAAERAKLEATLRDLPGDVEIDEEALAEIDGQNVTCPINFRLRFFVRPQNVAIDKDAWRECSGRVSAAAQKEIKRGREAPAAAAPGDAALKLDEQQAIALFSRVVGGVNAAVEDPEAFNKDVNDWLARIMFLMTPMLALLLGLFIRGRDALLFDHLVLSLYAHATGFAIVGAGIIAAGFGIPNAGPWTVLAIGLYFLLALKRAYRRGWTKTVFTTLFASLLYLAFLSGIVALILVNAVWANG